MTQDQKITKLIRVVEALTEAVSILSGTPSHHDDDYKYSAAGRAAQRAGSHVADLILAEPNEEAWW